jgi:hypothetical protein
MEMVIQIRSANSHTRWQLASTPKAGVIFRLTWPRLGRAKNDDIRTAKGYIGQSVPINPGLNLAHCRDK